MARLGQHFLTDPNLLDRIVDAAELSPGEDVLEIGPGKGHLTVRLLDAGANVHAIELDRGLVHLLEERIEAPAERFTLVEGDAADVDWPPFDKLVANLPYQISSPVIGRLLEAPFGLAVLTLQKEFAQRLVADPGTKACSRLTIRTQLASEPELLFTIKPGSFTPPPEIDSACIRLRPREPPDLHDPGLFDDLLDHAFNHRRKMLRSSLKSREGVRPVLEAMDVATERPEDLTPEMWVELANGVAERREEDP